MVLLCLTSYLSLKFQVRPHMVYVRPHSLHACKVHMCNQQMDLSCDAQTETKKWPRTFFTQTSTPHSAHGYSITPRPIDAEIDTGAFFGHL